MRPGQSFEESEVAAHYQYRPDYPEALFTKLIELSPGHGRALDLGCGTGKIARRICQAFTTVTAVDASAEMLEVARHAERNRERNIAWICGLAENADLSGDPFDLIVAGASIHWMEHSALFSLLRDMVQDNHVFAVVDGDGAYQPVWQDDWDSFLAKWIFEIKGEKYEPARTDSSFAKRMTRHREWLRLDGEAIYNQSVRQSVDEFILCQFSRDTFAPSKLGERTEEFSEDLRVLLDPYADSSNMLTYDVQTRVEWGGIAR